MTHTLTISGMSCDHCVRRVTKALDNVPNLTVKQVEVGRAVVDSQDEASMRAAIEALHQVGYGAEVTS